MYTPAECSPARHHHLIHARVIYSIAAAHLRRMASSPSTM